MLRRKGKNIRGIGFLLAIFYCFSSAFGESNFRLEVSPQQGTLADEFSMSVIVENHETDTYPYLTGGEDFELSFIGPQSSVKIINGNVSRRNTYLYRLTPKKAGVLKTPAAELEVNGKKLIATAKSIKVTEAEKGSVQTKGKVFVRQRVSAKNVYAGQQILNTLEMYRSVELYDGQFTKPSFDEFWVEEFEEEVSEDRVIDNIRYRVNTVRMVLFPLGPGEEILPAARLRGKIRKKARGSSHRHPFDGMGFPATPGTLRNFDFDSFFGRIDTEPVSVLSDQPVIEVKALPDAPPGLPLHGMASPLVGETQVRIKYDASPVPFGESKTIIIQVQSYGNLRPLKEIQLSLSEDKLRVYREDPRFLKNLEGDRVLFTREFHYSVIPQRGGKIAIPPVQVGYFDPEKKEFQIASSDPIQFSVKGGPAPEPQKEIPAVSNQDVAETTGPNTPDTHLSLLEKIHRTIPLQTLLYVCFLGLLIVLVLFLFWRFQKKGSRFRKYLRGIDAAKNTDELSVIFRQALADLLDTHQGSTTDQFRYILNTKEIAEDLQLSTTLFLDKLDHLNYSEPEISQEEVPNVQSKAKELLRVFQNLQS